MNPKISIIGAGDRGANTYARLISENNLGEIVRVCDTDSKKLEAFEKKYPVGEENHFTDYKEMLSQKKGNVAIIATPDKTHLDIVLKAIRMNYHVLLEKPVGTSPREVIKIVEESINSDKVLSVSHVLRYTPFFREIKRIVDQGDFGELITVNHNEDIGNWHFAHSYVRGNWNKKEDSGPITLTKSCHDFDLLYWFFNSFPKTVFSKGDRFFFKKENMPEKAGRNCFECDIENCNYDAKKIYLDDTTKNNSWIKKISPDGRAKIEKNYLEENGYHRCVWQSDNDVCDHQNAIIEFENGKTATFNLGLGPDTEREINLYFEKGKVEAKFHQGFIKKIPYPLSRKYKEVETIKMEKLSGHEGGDEALINNFIRAVNRNDGKSNKTELKGVLPGHLMAFAAEKSRIEGEKIEIKNLEWSHNSDLIK